MKRFLLLLLLMVAAITVVSPCHAAEIDPILLNEPNPYVFGCRNDVFIELTQQPYLSKVASGRTAADYFIYFRAKILFLVEGSWNGIDKSSFEIKHTTADGHHTYYPLDYAVTMIANLKDGWHTFAEPYDFTDLRNTNLIFDVVPYSYEGWSFVFRPTERGSATPYCEIEIPLKVR
ncbi:MAG: hypothetical protein IJI57_01540 [Flexilinea sp.]|nr:hypothetical protein [Flexilinea sp.]